MSQTTAETVFEGFQQLVSSERAKFFALLAESSVRAENFSHDQVFGHLASEQFTASEAAEYLEVSIATLRRYIKDGRISPSAEMGRNQLFATKDLKAFKRSLRAVKGRAVVPAA